MNRTSFTSSRCIHVVLERLKLDRPERLDPLNPGMKLGKRLWSQPVDTHARIVFGVHVLNHATLPQHLQVAAGGGPTHIEGLGDVIHSAGLLGKQFDDPAAGRFGQDLHGTIMYLRHALYSAPMVTYCQVG